VLPVSLDRHRVALDAITLVNPHADDLHVASALAWLADRQNTDGLWHSTYQKARDPHIHAWVSYAAARIFRRVHSDRR
jgi:hypothetical protein